MVNLTLYHRRLAGQPTHVGRKFKIELESLEKPFEKVQAVDLTGTVLDFGGLHGYALIANIGVEELAIGPFRLQKGHVMLAQVGDSVTAKSLGPNGRGKVHITAYPE